MLTAVDPKRARTSSPRALTPKYRQVAEERDGDDLDISRDSEGPRRETGEPQLMTGLPVPSTHLAMRSGKGLFHHLLKGQDHARQHRALRLGTPQRRIASPAIADKDAPRPSIGLVRIENSYVLWQFYIKRFSTLQWSASRFIATAWVNAVAPMMQTHNPHTAGDEVAPYWWPKSWSTIDGDSIRQIELDCLLTRERIPLLAHILRLIIESSATQHPSIEKLGLNTAKLEELAMGSLSSIFNYDDNSRVVNSRIVKDIFRIAKVQEQYKRGDIDGRTEVFIIPEADGLQSDPEDDEDEGLVQSSHVSPPKASGVESFLPSETCHVGNVDSQIPASSVAAPELINVEQLVRRVHLYHKKDLESSDLWNRLDDKEKRTAALISELQVSRSNAGRVESSLEHHAVEPPGQSEAAEGLEAGRGTTEMPHGKVGGHVASRHHSQFLAVATSETPRRNIKDSPAYDTSGRTEQASDAMSAIEISPRRPTMVKRVGAVTLRVEVLSYSAAATLSSSSAEDIDDNTMVSMLRLSTDSEGEDADTTMLVDDDTGQEQGSSHNTAQDVEAPAQQSSGASTTIVPVNPGGSASHLGNDNGKDEDDDEKRRKKRRRSKALGAPNSPLPSLRLACPYQAYEPWRRCFQQANGCEDIARLKQHLARKHMVSFRCQNCWASCETRQKTASHSKDKQCKTRTKPTDECFMDLDHEEYVENTSRKASAEAIWWAMFKLLIRGIDGIEDMTLQAAYSPYYRVGMKPVVQWMHAPLALASEVLQSAAMGKWTPDGGTSSHPPFGESSNFLNLNPQGSVHETSASSARGPSMTTQAITLPVYEVTFPCPPTSSAATIEPSELTPDPLFAPFGSQVAVDSSSPMILSGFMATSEPAQGEFDALGDFQASVDMSQPSTSEFPFATSVPDGSGSNSTPAGRNYQRLMQRFEFVRAENQRLREASTAGRFHLDQVEQFLEEVLLMGNLPEEAYDCLAKASDSVMAIKRKLC